MEFISKRHNSEIDKSIAVLPFVNISADPNNEYFSDGITEEIINALTKIDGLKVIARTSSFSFKGSNQDIRSIGKALGVSSILEGSVRKVNNRVRITAQLINARDGIHFWSQNFDRELNDIFELQDEISLLIANQIRDNFGHFNIQEHLVITETSNVTAYEMYLKGHYYQLKWDADSIKKAIEYYQMSVELDTKFARSYYGLVQCYGLLAAWGYMHSSEGFAKAIDNFLIASDLNKSLPEYGQSFVGRAFWMEWDFQATYNQLLKTLSQYPKYTDGLEAMAELFIAHGKWKMAEVYIRRAMDVDPLSANHFYTLANIQYYQKKFDLALTFIEKSLSINPDLALAKELKALCFIWLGRKNDFEKLMKSYDNSELQRLLYEVINHGINSLSEELLNNWKTVIDDTKQLVPYELYILANTQHRFEALELLRLYIKQKRGQIINFRFDPLLVNLQENDEFHHLYPSQLLLEIESNIHSVSKNKTNTSLAELDEQMNMLKHYFDKEKPYLDSMMSLTILAKAINFHPNKLSYLINEKTGMNFNEFVNHYRLAYFKEIALNIENNNLSLLGLAYESGFNSKSVFNAFFKKVENTTPNIWLKKARQKKC
ncbi:helix-turn-helix domain-containing protein [Carboxylicivirga caseinilyticus]|uniref:helix-turn-helix domain-containing protein n=1 Tax=Carboxylicivirga caseinilyticus TaxID=3417572 RepID=UPI003D338CBE|nr:helix-turn-helix domain-containing protein [Marinilabiliaceae bacterium A049]